MPPANKSGQDKSPAVPPELCKKHHLDLPLTQEYGTAHRRQFRAGMLITKSAGSFQP